MSTPSPRKATPAPPPGAPDATALVERLKRAIVDCAQEAFDSDNDGYRFTAEAFRFHVETLQSAITHLAAHAELQARCARLEEDGKRMRDALNFIVSECDWEEDTHTGDNRIGTACHEALAARTAKEATP